jgi:hypothetical protein
LKRHNGAHAISALPTRRNAGRESVMVKASGGQLKAVAMVTAAAEDFASNTRR